MKRLLSIVVFVFMLFLITTSISASPNKQISIDQGSQVYMDVGETITLDTSGVNHTMWSVTKGNDLITLKKQDKNSANVTALEEGTVVITVEHDRGKNTPDSSITIIIGQPPTPDFTLSQVGIVIDYALVDVVPVQNTIMDNSKYITKWYKMDGNGKWDKNEFAKGLFPHYVVGCTLDKEIDENDNITFKSPQTVAIKAVTYNADTLEEVISIVKELEVDFNGNLELDSSWFHPIIVSTSPPYGNRATKVNLSYNISPPDLVTLDQTNKDEFHPYYVIKSIDGETSLDGDLVRDGVDSENFNQSTSTIKYLKSSSGYSESYKIQICMDMILKTKTGYPLPSSYYSVPADIEIISRENLQ